MKKIIGVLVICMLLTTFVLPASAIFNDINILLKNQDPNSGRLPPDPGDMAPGFVLEYIQEAPIKSNQPRTIYNFDEEAIIEIIESIDEDLILGYLEDLVAFGPRVTGSQAVADAGEYIYEEFESYGLEARYDDWSYGGYSGNNIEGTHPGVDEESDEIYIICAHYDSVPGSPGADDDGSGTAAVLAAAYIMSQFEFNHTIKFVAFDGEEQGLLGSHEYAEEAYANGDNIVGVLNGDMIGYAENPTQASYIKIYSNSQSLWIRNIIEDVSEDFYDYCGLEIDPQGAAYNSDHASFWTFGYNAVMYHEYEFNAYYHSPQDIIDNMDIDYCTRVTKLEIASLCTISEAQASNYPPDKAYIDGPNTGTEFEEITFTTRATDPEGDMIFYDVDWDDGTTDWFGPYPSGETVEISNSWDTPGTYNVRVRGVDIKNKKGEWSIPLTIEIGTNQPPNAPTINGPKTGSIKRSISYKISSNDPEGHDIYFSIDWGDGNYMPYTGPFSSDEEVTFSHAWSEPDQYTIKVKAKDEYEGESPQSSFKVQISKSRSSINFRFNQLFENLMNRHISIIELLIALIRM
jgi:hypothetical protein